MQKMYIWLLKCLNKENLKLTFQFMLLVSTLTLHARTIRHFIFLPIWPLKEDITIAILPLDPHKHEHTWISLHETKHGQKQNDASTFFNRANLLKGGILIQYTAPLPKGQL